MMKVARGGARRKFGANRSTKRRGKGKKVTRAMREMKKREPQLVEGEKNMLLMRGPTSSEMMSTILSDLQKLRAPCVKKLTRKNPIRPFETSDLASLEFLANKNDCALFAHATHSKKRPNNLTMGRLFNDHVLDMVEFGVVSYEPISGFKGFGRAPGSKPVLTFTGHEFEHDPTLQKVKSLLMDLFRGRPATDVCLPGIDHLISFTMVEGRIAMRTYAVQFKKSGSRVPRVALGEMGPHMDLVVRRSQFASPSLSKLARKQARQVKPPKVKNVSTDEFDNKVGRVHMLRQDYGNLHTRKLKGLKKRNTPTLGDAEEQPPSAKRSRR